jgi:dihydrofolate reductase
LNNVGALVCGRRLYEQTGGWGGTHPIGAPVFVVTHEPPAAWPQGSSSFTFVTEGVAAAVDAARRVAGDKHVAIATPTITQQCLNLRLLDRIQVSLIPVLLGAGLRFFEYLDDVPVRLGDPTVIESRGVTHLYYDVTYPGTRS